MEIHSQTILHTYDGNNRLLTITYPAGTPVTFGYDANGKRTSMTDSLGSTTYSYDAINRLASYTDSSGMAVAYAYDANGNRISMTYPGNKIVNYTFDAMNRMLTVKDWLNGITTSTYDAAGNLTMVQNPNGTTARYGFDNAGRLTSLTNSRPDTTVISSYALTLDGVGNHLQSAQTEPLDPVIATQTGSYAYDTENRLTNTNGATFTYDANGNMLTKGVDTFAYDYENRLTQTIVGGTSNSYQYDGLGNRLQATHGGVTTKYVLDVNGSMSHVLAETDAGGTATAYYIYGRGLISRITAGGTACYYHYDVRGSTVALSDSSGALTDKYAYDPFGSLTNSAGTSVNPFKYVGRYGVMDEGNSLSYIRARYYSPGLGRFVTKDPTTGKDGDSQSLNRYIYAVNNPLRMIDIFGLSAQEASQGYDISGSSDDLGSHNALIGDRGVAFLKLAATPFTWRPFLEYMNASAAQLAIFNGLNIVSRSANVTKSFENEIGLKNLITSVRDIPATWDWLNDHPLNGEDWLNIATSSTTNFAALMINVAISISPEIGYKSYQIGSALSTIGTGKDYSITGDGIQTFIQNNLNLFQQNDGSSGGGW